MKITANNWREHFAWCPIITVDGAAVDRVLEADDEQGYVIAYVTKNGALVVDKEGDRIETQRLTGKVEFIGGDRRS